MHRPTLGFLLAIATQLGATDCGQVIRDSSFDLWCGEELCAWKVTRGDIQRVPTWNEGDSGVELVGADAAIQQLSPVNHGDGMCIEFHLVANVEESAEVFLEIDVEGDGTVERSERIPTARWKPLSYNISVAPPFDGIRFEITKRGSGTASLANIGAKTVIADRCVGLSALDPGPRRNGALCTESAQCGSAICGPSPSPPPATLWFNSTCLGCDPRGPNTCGNGMVCGLGDAFSPVFAMPAECIPAAQKEVGEVCLSDAECGTDICWKGALQPMGVCSTCRLDSDCAGGELCAASWSVDSLAFTGPFVCGANAMAAASGAACASDDDCASGLCNGAVRAQCGDGRSCISPADCPFGIGGIDPLQNGACDTVGIQGGTCQ